jgi:nucleosome binding factor SPN SPT16 subunit
MTKREKDKKELADVITQDRLIESRSASVLPPSSSFSSPVFF